MDSLLQAIETNQLCKTQGRDWKDKMAKAGRVTEYLRDKLQEQIDKCKRRSAFDYLRDHSLNSNPVKVKEFIDALNARHTQCILADGGGYPQLKVPCASVTVSKSDKNAGKQIGLLQIQSYNLSAVLDEIKTDDELVTALKQLVADAQTARRVGGHLCKRVCLNRRHIVQVSANVNVKFHEACPAMWVINDQLYSFCHCPMAGNEICLAPGGLFAADASCAEAFKRSVQSLLQNRSNV